jgi:hypothetical protein
MVLSSIGWVDHGALWRYDVATGAVDAIPAGEGATYLSLHTGGAGRFAVAHHFDGKRFEITVREFAAPEKVLARATIDPDGSTLSGDASAWADVPRLYVAMLSFAPWDDFVLVRPEPDAGRLEVFRLEWFDQSYDKMYQGVVDVVGLPDGATAVVSVQRSSRIIVHDLATGKARSVVDLGGRAGNPKLTLREGGSELWADDYDCLVVVHTRDWQVDRKRRMQSAISGTQQFMGDYAFARDAPVCVVARPFAGAVDAVHTGTLKTLSSAKVGGQPLQVAALPEGRVVARDWKTGALLQGRLELRRAGLPSWW